jgi:flavin-dependent thymidylate synthase
MFRAEEMPFNVNEQGPQAHLIGMTADPLGHIAAACMMYEGKVVRSLSDVTHEQRKHYFEQVKNTKLKAPFEFVKLHFMFDGVTRSFTHQMVRQRTAVYAQESLRFAVKDGIDEEVALPPSLAALPQDDPRVRVWKRAVNAVDDSYHALVESGVPAEDARGLLPHNITTRLHYSTDLRALQDHAGNRLCTQAQFEWRAVWTRIVEAIRNYRPHAAMIKSAVNMGERFRDELAFMDASDAWQYEALADLFRPVCYLTGKCEFMANFDRSCSIRDRVEANHHIGRPSSEWGEEYDTVAPEEVVIGVGPKSVVHSNDRPVFIGAIKPAEWLLDPGAAR